MTNDLGPNVDQWGNVHSASNHADQPAQEPDRQWDGSNREIHLAHCNQGEYVGICKYGYDSRPAITQGEPPATAGEWHIYRYSNPNDGSEAPYEDLYICLCEDGKSCELPNERFIDVYAEDYAEKVAITDQIVADHNAASRYDALTTEASPNE